MVNGSHTNQSSQSFHHIKWLLCLIITSKRCNVTFDILIFFLASFFFFALLGSGNKIKWKIILLAIQLHFVVRQSSNTLECFVCFGVVGWMMGQSYMTNFDSCHLAWPELCTCFRNPIKTADIQINIYVCDNRDKSNKTKHWKIQQTK